MPPQRMRIADVKNKVDLLEKRIFFTWAVNALLTASVLYLIFSS